MPGRDGLKAFRRGKGGCVDPRVAAEGRDAGPRSGSNPGSLDAIGRGPRRRILRHALPLFPGANVDATIGATLGGTVVTRSAGNRKTVMLEERRRAAKPLEPVDRTVSETNAMRSKAKLIAGAFGGMIEPPSGTMHSWERVRSLIVDQSLDEANEAIIDLLDQRIAGGDQALHAVRILLQHYIEIVVNLEPMAHLGCAPLRPDDRLVEAFAQIIDLMHGQNQQLNELQALASDLI
jgi:hypothetical protein